jgi:hypothetical protein
MALFLDFLRRIKEDTLSQEKSVSGLLPRTKRELLIAGRDGTAFARAIQRSLSWIESTGQCRDNIRAGESTIESAGRGAFASRKILKGSVIAPAPLVHVSNRTAFDVDLGTRQNATQQLMVNYCFGHAKIDALLCPATDAVLINHSSDSNARIQWALEDDSDSARLGSLVELNPNSTDLSSFNTRLVIEYVATKDIEPGEEIFIDYSIGWESDYQDHMKSFVSLPRSDFVPATALNEQQEPLVLSEELDFRSYSYECKLYAFVKEYIGMEITIEDFTANKNIHFSQWDPDKQDWYRYNDPVNWYPCQVLGRATAPDTFVIKVFSRPLLNTHMIRYYDNCPRSRIRYAGMFPCLY